MARKPTAEEIVERLGLKPLPREGGLYRQMWVSPHRIALAGDEARPCGTAIYYLLTGEADSFSALHRLQTDEIWHFYLGDPLEMTLLHGDGRVETVLLGADILSGQRVQWVAPAGAWQGTRLAEGGTYGLVGTTMAPGFIASDLEIGERGSLIAQYPQAEQQIRALTRASAAEE